MVPAAASILFVAKFFFMRSTAIEAKEIWRFTVPATVAMLGYTIITQVDIILATSLLVKEQPTTMRYSSLAKIILFLPGAVSTVMFPKLSKAHAIRSRGGDESSRILKTALL